jgi:hypothetical protein
MTGFAGMNPEGAAMLGIDPVGIVRIRPAGWYTVRAE